MSARLIETGLIAAIRSIQVAGVPVIPAGFAIVEFENAPRATGDRMIVKATKADNRDDGPKGALFDVSIELRTRHNFPAATAESYWDAADKAIFDRTVAAPAAITNEFDVFIITSTDGGARENEDKSRRRELTFQVWVKEKP